MHTTTDNLLAAPTAPQGPERFRLLIENSHDVVAEVSEQGQVLYVSPNVTALLGYDPGELIGTHIFDRVHGEDLPHVQEQFALPAGTAACRYRHRDGSWRWLETSGRDFLMPDGETHGVLVIRDVTDRMQAEAERRKLDLRLRQLHRMEALGTLAGGIAHDFNNLLTVILGCTDLAVMDIQRPEDAVKHLAQVQKASERARELVQQILVFSRQQKLERRPTRLVPIAEEVVELMRHSLPSTVEIVATLAPAIPIVIANPTQIHQVLVNLCTNAAHAMRERNGRLTVTLAQVDVSEAQARIEPGLAPGLYARITISDTGHGMDAETCKHIFEPFFTTKQPGEGTGLGLSVVHGIVRDHHGIITVNSTCGVGTTLDIYLPAHDCEAPPLEDTHHTVPRGRDEHILLVDDEPAVCESLSVLLTRLGYRVTATTKPAEALELVRQNTAPINLLISDLTMPGMTGTSLVQQIRALQPRLPILLATGSTELDPAAMRRIGVHGLLPKPIRLHDLAEVVHETLHLRHYA